MAREHDVHVRSGRNWVTSEDFEDNYKKAMQRFKQDNVACWHSLEGTFLLHDRRRLERIAGQLGLESRHDRNSLGVNMLRRSTPTQAVVGRSQPV